MKRFAILAGAACLLLASFATAQAYEGGWAVDNNLGGREILLLGDSSDGSFLRLRGTARWCGQPGDAYSTVRGVLRRNGQRGQLIYWRIADYCDDGYVRVCVENLRGQRACSTYIDEGWQ